MKLYYFLLIVLSVNLQGIDKKHYTLELGSNKLFKSISEWEYMPGNEHFNINERVNDKNWSKVFLYRDFIKKKRGIHLYKKKILIKGKIDQFNNLAVKIRNLPWAYELYWDGSLITSNGKTGINIETEISGNYQQLIKIPKELLKPGTHTLILRVSNFSDNNYAPGINIFIGFIDNLKKITQNNLDKNLLFIGIYLTALLFAMALYLGGEKSSFYLFFILYCLINLISAGIIYYNESSDISISSYYNLSLIDYIGYRLDGFILNIFLLFYLEIKKRLHLTIMISTLIFIQLTGVEYIGGFSSIEVFMNLYGLFLLIYGIRKKKQGSTILLIGFLFPLIVVVYRFFTMMIPSFNIISSKFLYTFVQGLFLTFIMMGISKKIRWETLRLGKLKLRSKRLETELLKKNIQPHFIMNTLQSIKSLIALDKNKAEGLIESLADEFRIINRIHSKSTIQLREEIDLCKHHLKLMGYRRDAQYKLEIINKCENVLIPPMIIHTLVENGLTHAFLPKEMGLFKLECSKKNGSVYIKLKNNGSKLREFSALPSDKIEEGSGLKYVKTRLEENYSGRWSLKYGMNDIFWEVIIEIKDGEV